MKYSAENNTYKNGIAIHNTSFEWLPGSVNPFANESFQ